MKDPEKEKELKRFKKVLAWLNLLFAFFTNLLGKMHKRSIESVKKINE